jgi:uncharacterized membrane protein YphA (DoxX/SURF4 family)
MKINRPYKILTYSIATVWIINGFFCKVLNLVPRHEQIVQAITNVDRPSAYFLTFIIGICEIVMAIWILSGYRTKLNAIIQIAVVATMNILEFILVPDLLLWGELNSLFAFVFTLVVYYNEFHLNKK